MLGRARGTKIIRFTPTRVVSDKLNLENRKKILSSKVNNLKWFGLCDRVQYCDSFNSVTRLLQWLPALSWLPGSEDVSGVLPVPGTEGTSPDWEKPLLWHHNGYKIWIVKHWTLQTAWWQSWLSWTLFWDKSTFQNTWMFPKRCKMMCNVGAWCQEVPSVHLVYTCTQGNSWDDWLVLAVRTSRNCGHCKPQAAWELGITPQASDNHRLLLPGGQGLQHLCCCHVVAVSWWLLNRSFESVKGNEESLVMDISLAKMPKVTIKWA